ncbi:MAG: Asp23/Gls24 family envelope stress response protein [Mycoplasmatales bacterium]
MEIIIKGEEGNIIIDTKEVELFIAEQLKMIPGILRVSEKNVKSIIKGIFSNEHTKGIEVDFLQNEELGVKCYIVISAQVNFAQVTQSIQEIVRYSIRKKYGIKVNYIDVFVKGME